MGRLATEVTDTKVCTVCEERFPLEQFALRSRKSNKRRAQCITCYRILSKNYARAQRRLNGTAKSNVIDVDFIEHMGDLQSISVLRRALKMPPLRTIQVPCARCHQPFSAQIVKGIRKRWHCRLCLHQLQRESSGLLEVSIGKI